MAFFDPFAFKRCPFWARPVPCRRKKRGLKGFGEGGSAKNLKGQKGKGEFWGGKRKGKFSMALPPSASRFLPLLRSLPFPPFLGPKFPLRL